MRKALINMIRHAEEEVKNNDISNVLKDDFIKTVEENGEVDHIPSKTVSPSSMNCVRQMCFKYNGTKPTNVKKSYTLDIICEIGTKTHEFVQKNCLSLSSFEYVNVADYVRKFKPKNIVVYKESNFVDEFETHLYYMKDDKPVVSFLCDGVLKSKKTGKYYILEIKTEGSGAFFKQDGVQEKHKNQATAYSLLLDIPTVVFMYFSRDIPNVKTYSYTPSREEKETLKNKINSVIEAVDNGVILPKPMAVTKRDCAYCIYKSRCKDIGLNEYSIDKEDAEE